MRIVVVGGGVVGLSTATRLQEILPEAEVTLVARAFSPDTTSDGAAGIFTPHTLQITGLPESRIRRLVKLSFQRYDKLAYSEHCKEAGVVVISGYQLYDTEDVIPRPLYADFVYQYRPCTQRELDSFSNKFKSGYFSTTVLVECKRYLPWLTNRFKQRNGKIETRYVKSLEEFVGQCDLVVNCSGLGSRDLVGDRSIVAMRGQSMSVSAPWVKHFYRDVGASVGVVPCYDTVSIGGVRELSDDTDIHSADSTNLKKTACDLLPGLWNSPVLWEWVGLRPWRQPLRLEQETLTFKTGSVKVVHNYGHCGNGVALSWGTAVEAADMVKDLLTHASLSAKL